MRLGCVLIAAGIAGSCFAAGNSIGLAANPADATRHRLQLTTLVNPALGSIGLILKARVDGGPPLRLLLDSGAEHLVLSRSAVRKTAAQGAGLDLIGAGSSSKAARLTTAGSVVVGTLELRDCPMVLVDGRVGEGIDGVLPLSLFAGFLIRLDIPRRLLELEPYPAAKEPQDPTYARAARHGNLLFLESPAGYLLLDTGSSYNVINKTMTSVPAQARVLPVAAAAGKVEGRVLSGRLAVQSAAGELGFDSVVAMDMAEISRRHGVQVFGIIGYPALARSVVSVNYQESLVRIQSK
jgi:Aspartyl protease